MPVPVSEGNEENKSSSSEILNEDEQMPVPVSEENKDLKSTSSKKLVDNEKIESDSSDSEIRNQEPHASLAQQLQNENSADERPRTPVEKILKSASEKLENLKQKFRKGSKSESGKINFYILIWKLNFFDSKIYPQFQSKFYF